MEVKLTHSNHAENESPMENMEHQYGRRYLARVHNQKAIEVYVRTLFTRERPDSPKNEAKHSKRKSDREDLLLTLAHRHYSDKGIFLPVPIWGSCDERFAELLAEVHLLLDGRMIPSVASFDQTTVSRNLGGMERGRYPWR